MNVTTVRDELVEQLQSITGLTVSERVPSVLQPPHAYISNITVRPGQSFDGLAEFTFEVTVLVSRADDDTGWDTITNLMGTVSGSIDYALQANNSLDTTVQYTTVEQFDQLGETFDFAGVGYLGFVATIPGMST